MRNDREREKLIEHCLFIGFRKDNIEYMDWNTVDWHLKDQGLQKVSMVYSTMGDRYGFITIEGLEYEYFIHLKKVTVKQKKQETDGISSEVTATEGT